MKTYAYDVIVVGSGVAGYNCADTLWNLGMKNIALITENQQGGTSRNTGSDKQTYYKLSLAGDKGDSVLSMAQTYFAGGGMDGDIALAEAANSVSCFMKLVHLGVDFPTNAFGEFVGYKTDHDPFSRATSVGPYTSKKMTEALETAVKTKGIPIFNHTQAVKILTSNNAVAGCIALDKTVTDRAEYIAFATPHIVLATGGPAAIYADRVYPVSQTGSSALALWAGADFANLSEWQYGLASTDFRWNVSGSYQQALPRYISIDETGQTREFLCEHFANNGEMLNNIFLKGYEWPFDVGKLHGSSFIDLLVYRESVVLGRAVYMDFTEEPTGIDESFSLLGQVARTYLANSNALVAKPIERLRKINPDAIALYAEHGIDITREPLRVAVCAQHNNGGIRVDANWQSTVQGLYAAGEAAGSFGVFRPGGSALNSCMVGSARAAAHIAKESRNKHAKNFETLASQAVLELDTFLAKTKSAASTLSAKRCFYQQRMSKTFAFLRDISAMETDCESIAQSAANFTTENKWANASEIPSLFKNFDIVWMQSAVANAMVFAAKQFGARGSAYVLDGADFMARKALSGQNGENAVLVTKKEHGIRSKTVPPRPIPERDLWFERVWQNYKHREGGKK